MARPLKRYPLDQSPFYKLGSPSRLAKNFGHSVLQLQRLADHGDENYLIFTIKRGTPKERDIECPKPRLERIHSRAFTLLQRIQPPDFLHSGTRGRSYISNAQAHINAHPLIKLDIKRFFPSTAAQKLFHCLTTTFQMAPDAAGLLTRLLTVKNHVPTGSCVSQVIAFYANYGMFEEIATLCAARGLTLTVYVDDLTVSGPGADQELIRKIGSIITKHGLAYHKVRAIGADEPKVVTGVVVTAAGIKVQNRKRRMMHEELLELRQNSNDPAIYDLCCRLLGRVMESHNVEPAFAEVIAEVRSIRRKLATLAV